MMDVDKLAEAKKGIASLLDGYVTGVQAVTGADTLTRATVVHDIATSAHRSADLVESHLAGGDDSAGGLRSYAASLDSQDLVKKARRWVTVIVGATGITLAGAVKWIAPQVVPFLDSTVTAGQAAGTELAQKLLAGAIPVVVIVFAIRALGQVGRGISDALSSGPSQADRIWAQTVGPSEAALYAVFSSKPPSRPSKIFNVGIAALGVAGAFVVALFIFGAISAVAS